MMKVYLLSLAALILLAGVPALAQNGCANSPENPTVLLALVGSAGGFVVAARNRLRRK